MPLHRRRHHPALLVLATALVVSASAPAAGQAPGETLPAPSTSLSADGRTATDGARTLSVSRSADLAAAGEAVTVEGRNYDVNKGIYVAYCVIPPTNGLPTPCGGGADMTGGGGASQWISSDAPSYGGNLARPYGAGGSFSVTITAQPTIGSIDCRRVRCAIVTRNDHTRASDRSQDIFIPVSFASDDPAPSAEPTAPGAPAAPATPGAPAPDPGAPPPPPPPPSTTITTAPQTPPDEPLPAPDTTVDDDGRRVSDGTRALVVSRAEELETPGEVLIVTGSGFDEARGVEVAWCAVGADDAPPGPCATSEAAAVLDDGRAGEDDDGPSPGGPTWISSTPPDDPPGGATPEPYGPSGSFGLGLAAVAEIDEDTDCREVQCAVVTRPDPARPLDRSQELVLPVSFAEVEADVDEPGPEEEAEADEPVAAPAAPVSTTDDGSSALPVLLGGLAVLVVAGGAVTAVIRSRRAGAT